MQSIPVLAVAVLTVPLLPLSDGPPRGLGTSDPWLDAHGDVLFGDLVVGNHSLVLRERSLEGLPDGGLQFGGANLCIELGPPCGHLTLEDFEVFRARIDGQVREVEKAAANASALSVQAATDAANASSLSQAAIADAANALSIARDSRPGYAVRTFAAHTFDQWGSSMAIGSDGRAILAFGSRPVSVAHCNDVACRSATVHAIEEAQEGWPLEPAISLVIGADDLPLLAYPGRIVHCEDLSCATFQASSIDSGRFPSLVVGGGSAVLFHQPLQTSELAVTRCRDPACASSSHGVLSEGGFGISATIDATGHPIVAHTNGSRLYLTKCLDHWCGSVIDRLVLDAPGWELKSTSIIIGEDALPLIGVYQTDPSTNPPSAALRTFHCEDFDCNAVTESLIASGKHLVFGDSHALALGSDGHPVIAYRAHYVGVSDYGATLVVARCRVPDCRSYSSFAVADWTANGIAFTSHGHGIAMTVGVDGFPLIAYGAQGQVSGDDYITVIHCSNRFCVPWHRES